MLKLVRPLVSLVLVLGSVARAEAQSIVATGTTCADLGLGSQQFVINAPVNGTYAVDAGNSLQFGYYDDTNTIFFFAGSTYPIKGVLVAGGGQTMAWELPAGMSGYPSLHGPLDPATNSPQTPTSVTFCYEYELRILSRRFWLL